MKADKVITSAIPLIFILAAIGLLGITGNLFSSLPPVIAVQVGAVGLNVWARIAFKRGTFRITAAPAGTSLIKRGPYRLIRHPMYSAVLLFVWAAVASHRSLLTLTIGLAVTAVGITRVVVEERLLRNQIPEYLAYAQSTKALIPFVF